MKYKTILLIILTFSIGCSKKEKYDYSNIYEISYDIIENCDGNINKLYSYEEYNVYTYCISNLDISINNKKISLYNALNNNLITLKDIIKRLDNSEQERYKDGGSIIYKTPNYNILSCHSIKGKNLFNTDFILGNNKMEYEDNFCK